MSTDTLVLDIPAARHLAASASQAADELFADQLALRSLLDDASAILRTDRSGALVSLSSARSGFDSIAEDLRARLDQIDQTANALGRIDSLTLELWGWPDDTHDGGREARSQERHLVILRLVGGDPAVASRVERLLDAGHNAATTFQMLDSQLRHEARIESLMAAFDIDEVEALAMIERVDVAVEGLLARGMSQDDAVTALAIVENFGLDLAVALDHAVNLDIGLLDALGRMLTANGLGVTIEEYGALEGLEQHFEVFDNATGGARDERVSASDLQFVVDNPWRFAPTQVLAAQALLDQPTLRNRLDTANSETELFAGDGFGSTEPGDGLIAAVDLQAFLLKAQLHAILGDYADKIDIASDPSGVVDGYRSKNDFAAFIADNPDLPESVLAAASVALDAGWFDESWWQEHKDELAMGAALLAAGLAVAVTGGAASMIVVIGVGALAAGGTTVAVNLATGESVLDDVFTNAVKGGFIGAGVHGVVTGAAAYGTASNGVARVAAIAGATSGAADVVAAGGLDLLIAEEYEDSIHDVANEVSTVTGAVDLGYNASEWATRRSIKFDSVEEQLEALTDRISRQKQLRHIEGSPLYNDGGYFTDAADAQRVLDAANDGSAEVFGITDGNDLLVRYDDVTGIHVNIGMNQPGIETNMFNIKGTAHPSVVPTRPWRVE